MRLLNVADMVPMTNIEEIPTENIAKAVFAKLTELFGTEEIASRTTTRPLTLEEDGVVGGELTECVLADLEDYAMISTFGVGGVETEGEVTVDSKKYGYHQEFYMVGASKTDAELFGELLAQLAFFVAQNKQPIIPGAILQAPDPDGEGSIFLLFSSEPLGMFSNKTATPIFTPDFGVFFNCVTKISEKEAQLLKTEGGYEKFNQYLTSLVNDAYRFVRPEYVEKAVPVILTSESN